MAKVYVVQFEAATDWKKNSMRM